MPTLPFLPWLHPDAPLTIVVEGVGDLVQRYLGPALQRATNASSGKVKVTFADDSRLWTSKSLRQKRQATVAALETWGATFLDKSLEPFKYNALLNSNEVDVVVVATWPSSHCYLAYGWLDHCRQIFIETPLDDALGLARTLALHVQDDDYRLFAFDNYRARFLPSQEQVRQINSFAGRGWQSAIFYLLEDGSGGQRNGPIENEHRIEALRRGVIRDTMPHVPAVLAYFGNMATLRVTEVRVGQYTGVDGDPGRRSEIDRETFAEVKFDFRDFRNNLVPATAYVGQGIGGVRNLHMEGDVELLELVALDEKRALFDFQASRATFVDREGREVFTIGLHPQPYVRLVESILEGRYLQGEHPLVFPFETGQRILEILEDATHPVPMNKEQLHTYPLGAWLEDLLDGGRYALPPLHPPVLAPWPLGDRRTKGDRRRAA